MKHENCTPLLIVEGLNLLIQHTFDPASSFKISQNLGQPCSLQRPELSISGGGEAAVFLEIRRAEVLAGDPPHTHTQKDMNYC
jgi:hypothetical protein